MGDAEVRRSGRAARRRCSAARCESAGHGRDATTRSPSARFGLQPAAGADADQAASTPSWISSSITIAALGQPMPVDCTDTGRPSKRARVAEHAALAVHLAGVVQELPRDPLGPQRIAGEEHRRCVVARLCAQVDRHGRRAYMIAVRPTTPSATPGSAVAAVPCGTARPPARTASAISASRSASGSVGRSRVRPPFSDDCVRQYVVEVGYVQATGIGSIARLAEPGRRRRARASRPASAEREHAGAARAAPEAGRSSRSSTSQSVVAQGFSVAPRPRPRRRAGRRVAARGASRRSAARDVGDEHEREPADDAVDGGVGEVDRLDVEHAQLDVRSRPTLGRPALRRVDHRGRAVGHDHRARPATRARRR